MNPEPSPAQAFDEDLPWLAFLYVSEELTPDEVADFEERLLTDQEAREAVAEAMKMADGLWVATAVETLQAPPDRGRPAEAAKPSRSRWSWWMTGTLAAAGLAFCVGWWLAEWETSNNPPRPVVQESEPEVVPLKAEELVGLWSNTYALVAELGPDSEMEFSSEEPAYREPPEPEAEAFSWMLAVVGRSSPETPETETDVMEN